MEAVMMHRSFDQSISPYKSHLKNPKKFNQNPIILSPSDAFWLSHFNSTGLLQAPAPPPFLSQSYPLRQSSQPPLLPLPAAPPRRSASARGLSCSPSNKKPSNNNPSLASKKSKSPKKEAKNSPKKSNGVTKVAAVVVGGGDMFSGSAAFAISPPPSSLPLPTFSLRPRGGCRRAAAGGGVDAGATDDLRRLLRLM